MNVIKPVFGFLLLMLPVSFLTIFLQRQRLKGVEKFALWWIPLSILLVATTPTTSGAWMPLYFVSREIITWIMGGLFTLISLIIIARSFFKKT